MIFLDTIKPQLKRPGSFHDVKISENLVKISVELDGDFLESYIARLNQYQRATTLRVNKELGQQRRGRLRKGHLKS